MARGLSRREFLKLSALTGLGVGAAALDACVAPLVPGTGRPDSTATFPPTDAATATKTNTPTSTATATETAQPTETLAPTETPTPEVGRFNVEGVLTYSDAYSRVETDSNTGFSASINIPDQLMVNTKNRFDRINYPAGFVTMVGKIQLYEMMRAQYMFSGGSMYPEVADKEYVPLTERVAYVDSQWALGPIEVDFVTDAKVLIAGTMYDGGKGKMLGEVHGVDMVFVSTLDELGILRDKFGRDPDVSVFIGDTNSVLYLEGGRLIQIMIAPETSPDPWGYTWVRFSDYDRINRDKSGVVVDFIRLLEKGVVTTQWLVGSDGLKAYWPWKYFSGHNLDLNEEIVGITGCSLSSDPYGCKSFYDEVFVQ